MKIALLKIVSFLGLAGTIIPSILVFMGSISSSQNTFIMAISMVLWFATAPFWINKKGDSAA